MAPASGALVTTWATNLAFERGASSCTLQASPMGEPIYRSLGYETVYRYARVRALAQPQAAPDEGAGGRRLERQS